MSAARIISNCALSEVIGPSKIRCENVGILALIGTGLGVRGVQVSPTTGPLPSGTLLHPRRYES